MGNKAFSVFSGTALNLLCGYGALASQEGLGHWQTRARLEKMTPWYTVLVHVTSGSQGAQIYGKHYFLVSERAFPDETGLSKATDSPPHGCASSNLPRAWIFPFPVWLSWDISLLPSGISAPGSQNFRLQNHYFSLISILKIVELTSLHNHVV